MKRLIALLGVTGMFIAGCQDNQAEAQFRAEEPYSANPAYVNTSDGSDGQSLDSLDTGYTDTTYENAAPAEPAAASYDSSDEPLAPIGGTTYTVQKGDTLYELARRFYSDQARWRDIWEANSARLANPDRLQIGMKLIIP